MSDYKGCPIMEPDYEVKKLRLEPGDIAVLSTDMVLSQEEARQIAEAFRRQVGDANKVLVLSNGVKLSVLTRAEIEAMGI